MENKLVYVDTDISLGTPGAEIDDGAALIFLSRNARVQMISAGSVFGNVPVQDAVLNLDRLLTWLGNKSMSIGLGAEKPLAAHMTWFEEWQSKYGSTMPWDLRPVTISAASLLVQTVCSNPHQASILALGPMTNLALAIEMEPQIVSLAREVIVMGGSFNIQNPAPEFNVRCDPEAAQIVFHAGWNLHILGLDITRRVHFSRSDFASLRAANPAVELLRAQAPGWIERMEVMGWEHDGCALHDAVAAAYLADRSLFQTEEARVTVELEDPDLRGVTLFSDPVTDQPRVNVVTDVDAEKCRELIWSHLHQ